MLPRLSGIMITEGVRRAIFAATGAGKPQVVGEGGTIGGNLVQSITLGEVVLIGPGGRRSLHLSFDHAPPTAASVPPMVAAQIPPQEATPSEKAP